MNVTGAILANKYRKRVKNARNEERVEGGRGREREEQKTKTMNRSEAKKKQETKTCVPQTPTHKHKGPRTESDNRK